MCGALELGPLVADELVGVKHVGADLVAEGDLALVAVELGQLGVALGLLGLVELGREHLAGLGAVLVLGALVLALHDDARGQVRQADGAGGLVDVLAAGAAGAVDVLADVLVPVDLHLDVVQLRQHVDRGEAGVPAVLGVERADAHQPVHAALAREIAVGVRARDVAASPSGCRPPRRRARSTSSTS